VARIESVKEAYTLQCHKAETKGTVKAVYSKSCNAKYIDIDIHKVKAADILNAMAASPVCVNAGCADASPVFMSSRKAAPDLIHADMPGCKKADSSLTIEELFKDC